MQTALTRNTGPTLKCIAMIFVIMFAAKLLYLHVTQNEYFFFLNNHSKFVKLWSAITPERVGLEKVNESIVGSGRPQRIILGRLRAGLQSRQESDS